MNIHITTFYIFDKLHPQIIEERRKEIVELGTRFGMRGLVLIGSEGFNLTVSGSSPAIQELKNLFFVSWNYQNILTKDSWAEQHPFREFRVSKRKEIVTLGMDDLMVPSGENCHLSPSDWNEMLEKPGTVIVDTRNWYETDVGKFRNAIDLRIEEFSQFPTALENAKIDKNANVLIYCTGGIRCEKAIEAMKQDGYQKVHQLEGGILKYLEEFPNSQFEGECFVFDHRVALDQYLKPSSRFRLCPHCGQPAAEKTNCLRCDVDTVVCHSCLREMSRQTCSKHCAHQYRLKPGQKGKHQDESTYKG